MADPRASVVAEPLPTRIYLVRLATYYQTPKPIFQAPDPAGRSPNGPTAERLEVHAAGGSFVAGDRLLVVRPRPDDEVVAVLGELVAFPRFGLRWISALGSVERVEPIPPTSVRGKPGTSYRSSSFSEATRTVVVEASAPGWNDGERVVVEKRRVESIDAGLPEIVIPGGRSR